MHHSHHHHHRYHHHYYYRHHHQDMLKKKKAKLKILVVVVVVIVANEISFPLYNHVSSQFLHLFYYDYTHFIRLIRFMQLPALVDLYPVGFKI